MRVMSLLFAVCIILSTELRASTIEMPSLYKSAKAGDKISVRLELASGGSLINSYDGGTVLHWATAGNSTDVINMLAEAGADIRALGEDNQTPLHWSAIYGSTDAFDSLMNLNADIASLDIKGNNVLHLGIAHIDMTKFLLSEEIYKVLKSNKIDINAKNKMGRTPLHLAGFLGNIDVMKYLIQNGADVNAVDNMGQTPLFNVVNLSTNNELKKIDLLLNAGSNPNVKDNDGYSPIDYARSNNDIKYISILNLYTGR